jgi:hypothetical protein
MRCHNRNTENQEMTPTEKLLWRIRNHFLHGTQDAEVKADVLALCDQHEALLDMYLKEEIYLSDLTKRLEKANNGMEEITEVPT